MSPIEIPQGADRDYLRAFGIVALFIAASPARMPCLVGYTRDLGDSLESIRTHWHWSVEMTHAWWLADDVSAQAIITAVTAAFPSDSHGRFDAHVDAVARKLARVAATAGTKLTPHAEALRRVQVAVAHVDRTIEVAAVTGELGWFNRAYRGWRTRASSDAAGALPYALAKSRLRAAVVRRIAQGHPQPIGEDLLSEVLPPITRKLAFRVVGERQRKRASE